MIDVQIPQSGRILYALSLVSNDDMKFAKMIREHKENCKDDAYPIMAYSCNAAIVTRHWRFYAFVDVRSAAFVK